MSTNDWLLENAKIYKFENLDNINMNKIDLIEFQSFYNLSKLNTLYKNLDTISFVELITDYNKLIIRGYEKSTISEKINSFFHYHFFYY